MVDVEPENLDIRDTDKPQIHVAVGVVWDERQRVLICLRKPDVHQGGKWEFPGGKVEAGEDIKQALTRELQEEVGITPISTTPLLKIKHDYPDRSVVLDVWQVHAFTDKPSGREGQKICWVCVEHLNLYPFPVANQAIIDVLIQHQLKQSSGVSL